LLVADSDQPGRFAKRKFQWETYSPLRVMGIMARRWVSGWKLDLSDREYLLGRFEPLFPDVIADHVTLRTGTDHKTPLQRDTCGDVVGEIDDGAGMQALIVRIGEGTTARMEAPIISRGRSIECMAGGRSRATMSSRNSDGEAFPSPSRSVSSPLGSRRCSCILIATAF
jgi:hypothetical protein